MNPLRYKKEKAIKDDGRYIIFYEFDRSPTDPPDSFDKSDRPDPSDPA